MKYRLTVGFAFWTVLMMILPAFGSYADDEIAELINEAEENRAESAPQGYTSLKDLAMLQDRLRSYQTMGEPSEAVVDNDINVIPGLRDVFMLVASKSLKDDPQRKWPYRGITEFIPDGTSKRFMCNYGGCSGKRSIKDGDYLEETVQRSSKETKQDKMLYCTRSGCFYKRKRRSGLQAMKNRDNAKLHRVRDRTNKLRPRCIGRTCNGARRQQSDDIKDRINISGTVNPSQVIELRCKGSLCGGRVTMPSDDISKTSDDTKLAEITRRRLSNRACTSFKCLVSGAFSTKRYRGLDKHDEPPKYDDNERLEDTIIDTNKEGNNLSELEIHPVDQVNNDSKLFPFPPCIDHPTKCTHKSIDSSERYNERRTYDDKETFRDAHKETSKGENNLSELEIFLLDQVNDDSKLGHNLNPSGPCMDDPTKCTHQSEYEPIKPSGRNNEHSKYDGNKAIEDTDKETRTKDDNLSELEIVLLDQVNDDSKFSHNTNPSGPCMDDPTKCTHRNEEEPIVSSGRDIEHPTYDDNETLEDANKKTSKADKNLSELESVLFDQINESKFIPFPPCIDDPTDCTHESIDSSDKDNEHP